MRNHHRLTPIILVLLVCLVMTAFTGCGKKTASAPTEPSTEAATEPTSAVNEEVSDNMKSLSLSAKVWSSSNGATITLEAVPRAYNQNQAVYFVVHLNGEKVEDIPCTWDGTAFTASADLEAAETAARAEMQ